MIHKNCTSQIKPAIWYVTCSCLSSTCKLVSGMRKPDLCTHTYVCNTPIHILNTVEVISIKSLSTSKILRPSYVLRIRICQDFLSVP